MFYNAKKETFQLNIYYNKRMLLQPILGKNTKQLFTTRAICKHIIILNKIILFLFKKTTLCHI